MSKSKFKKDTIWLTLAQLVLASSGILINIIIGNRYGSASLGVFNQTIAIFFLICSIMSFGLNNSTIKKISEDSSDVKRNKLIISSNLIITSIISLIVCMIGYFTVQNVDNIFSSPDIVLGVKNIFISIPIYNFNKILMSSLSGLRKQKEFSIARVIRWGSLIFLISYYSLFYGSMDNIYFSFLVSEMILLIYLYSNLKHFICVLFSYNLIYENLKFGGMTYISEIISYSKDKLDVIIVGYFLTSYQMGIFTFSYSFASGILIFSRVFMQNFNPIISNLWSNKNYDSLKKEIKLLKHKVRFIQFGAFILICFGFNIILPLMVSIPINDNVLVFNVMLLGFYIFSTISWLGSFLVMTGNLTVNILRVTLGLLFSVIVISILSYCYGINGAAIAVLVSNIFNFILIKIFTESVFRKTKNEQ